MYCKHCGTELSDSSKFCPNCGIAIDSKPAESYSDDIQISRNQPFSQPVLSSGSNQNARSSAKKPIYKKWWFWTLAVLCVISAFGQMAGNKSSETSKTLSAEQSTTASSISSSKNSTKAEAETTPVPTANPTATPKATPEPSEFHVGDIIDASGMRITYLSSGEYDEDNEFIQPADGNKYIFIELFCENTSKYDTSISSIEFTCYADGYACEQYFGGDNDLSATLSPERSTSGFVYFEVPEDAEKVEIEYEINWLTSKKVTFLFEGNVDSGITPEITSAASENAYTVGDIVDLGDIKITYLDCGEYESDNYFSQPSDGNRYIYCSFEVENTSKTDQYISSLSFDCFADGKSCNANYIIDESLDASLSSGRKTTGSVSFEVPLDAEIIEIEYLDNYWTSNRIVFSYSD